MKKASILAVICVGALSACGGGDSSGGSGGSGTVNFSVNPVNGPQCWGNDRESRFDGSFSTTVNCRWLCADYKANKDAYVSITFERRNEAGATWKVDREYISDGIC